MLKTVYIKQNLVIPIHESSRRCMTKAAFPVRTFLRYIPLACGFFVCFLFFSVCSSLLNTVDVHVVMSSICHFTSDIWKKINVAISNICYPEKSNAYLPDCSFIFSSELRHQKDQHTIKPAKRGKCISYVTTLSFNKLAMQQSGHEKNKPQNIDTFLIELANMFSMK